MAELRDLVVVLGDQLDLEAAAFDGFDAGIDAVWMAEVDQESTHVWSSKPRTALFLASMRHFALAHGHANRIQRLMVTVRFALMLGVDPKQVHAWYLAVCVDAVEWVELPDTLGMSQYADGGVALQLKHVARLTDAQKQEVSERVAAIRRGEVGAEHAGVAAGWAAHA